MVNPSTTYSRALRVVAAAVAVIALGKELAGGIPPAAAHQLLSLRATGAVLAIVLGALSSPRRSIADLRLLAFAIGLTGVGLALGAAMVVPDEAWEQAVSIVGIMVTAAVFMPWSWRWQVAVVAVVVPAATIVYVALVPRTALDAPTATRLLVVIGAFAALSVVGSTLADRARRKVAASEARYRGLFAGAGDAIAVLDVTGLIREANPRLAELLGRPETDLTGHALSEFYAPPSGHDAASRSPGVSVTAGHAAALTGSLGHVSLRLLRPDGRVVDVDASLARVDDGTTPLVQAILRDLTDQRAQERRQVQEQRLDSLARMAGALAHQFNNILGGILTHATVLRDEVTQPELRAAATEVVEGARRGRELTKELVGVTRQGTVTPKPTPPADIVESIAALARATVPAEVKVVTAAPAGLPAALADVDHVVHALLQLVLNARDAMRAAGGTLTLGAAEQFVTTLDPRWPAAVPGRYVRLFVRDTGTGMDAGTLEQVFEPFFSTKPMHEASGLGLTGVHAVAQAHRGAIGIESTPGRGTTVHFLIPATDLRVAGAAPGPTATGPAKAGATILVVDDEPIVRNSLRRALAKMGYHVLEAGDGPTAMAALQSAHPRVDLVILDLVLPGGGAAIYELLTAVQPGLKVVVSSGYSPDVAAAQGLANRADGFLPKPYEMHELRDAVAKALG